MSGYIHDDVAEIKADAASGTNPKISTVGWTKEQLAALDTMLQFAWNRGYKSAAKDLNE